MRLIAGAEPFRVLQASVPAWARRDLTSDETTRLLAAQRAISPISYFRAFGQPIEAPHYNPGGTMARRRRRRNAEQGDLFGGFSGPSGPVQGPMPAGHSRILKKGTSRERARGVYNIKTHRLSHWVDADGNKITGKRWQFFFRPGGVDIHGRRAGKAAAAARRPKKGGRKGGRTAAQRRATAKLVAWNRAKHGKKAKTARRSWPGRARMKKRITRMSPGVTFRLRGTKKRRGYTLKSKGRGRIPTREQLRRELAAMTKGRVTVRVAGDKKTKRRGFTVRNPRRGGRFIMHRRRNPSRRRRRNPMDLMGTAKRTIAAAVPAVAGGALVSVLDAKFLAKRSTGVQIAAKLVAAAAAGAFLRSRPQTALLLQGAILGSLGSQITAQLGSQTGMQYLVGADGQAMSALMDASGALNTMPSLHGLGTFDPNLG